MGPGLVFAPPSLPTLRRSMTTNHSRPIIIVTSCLVLAAACTKRVTTVVKTDRPVTIQIGGTLGCEVDYPVAVVYTRQHYPRWISADNEYWIHFVGGSPFPGIDPIDVP